MGDNRLEPAVLSDAERRTRSRKALRIDPSGSWPGGQVGILHSRTRHDQPEVSCHPVNDWSSPPGSATSLAATRPSLTPRWNPANRSRAAAGDLFGTTGCVRGME